MREFSHKSYASAFSALLRIQPDTHNPLIPIPKNTRKILYTLSPSFAKLQPQFEGSLGYNWAYNSIVWTGIPPEEREIAGGAFHFWLREAVWNVTKPSQKNEQKFLEQLAKEINAACTVGYIKCGLFPLSGFSLLNSNDRTVFYQQFVNTIQTGVLADKLDLSTDAKYSKGPEDQIALFRKMTNTTIVTDGQRVPLPSAFVTQTYIVIQWWYQKVMPFFSSSVLSIF